MTTVLIEAPVLTPEGQRAARKDAIKRLYEQELSITPFVSLDGLFVLEEKIHDTLARKTPIPEELRYFEEMEDGNPVLRETVGDERLIAWLVRIAKGETQFPSHN